MRPLRQQGTFKEKLNAVSSSVNFKNNELNIIAGSTTSNYDHKTFIRICYDGEFRRMKLFEIKF